ncbi:MAG: hypothetical protein ACAH59_10690, partial [Pseudobdellovibrionaceae bacterium]
MKTIIATFAAVLMISACSSKKKEAEKAASAPAPAPATAPAMSGSTTDSSMGGDSSMSSHD